MKRKDILGIKDLTKVEINEILDVANEMRDMIDRREKSAELRGKNVATLFYENSTRTKNSFETAAKNLGASTTSISVASSSVQKGESLIDTGKTLDAIGMDVMILRHPVAGAPRLLADNVNASVINAGDGMNEHPTQALLDLMTAQRRFVDLNGIKLVIVGDIKHSRVARSDAMLFTKFGAEVTVCAPETLMPAGMEALGATVETDFEVAAKGANIIMPLRIQRERMDQAYFSTLEEYRRYYGVTEKRLIGCDSDVIVMHPAPINREAEIDGDVADGYRSLIQEQVTNGVAVRMALLSLIINSRGESV